MGGNPIHQLHPDSLEFCHNVEFLICIHQIRIAIPNFHRFLKNICNLCVIKDVLLVRKQLTQQLPEGRFGPTIRSKVPML